MINHIICAAAAMISEHSSGDWDSTRCVCLNVCQPRVGEVNSGELSEWMVKISNPGNSTQFNSSVTHNWNTTNHRISRTHKQTEWFNMSNLLEKMENCSIMHFNQDLT